jgi:hypothetical protein
MIAYIIAIAIMAILGAAAWFATRLWERMTRKREAQRFTEGFNDGLGEDAGGSGTDKAEQENLRRKFLEGVNEYQRAGISVYESPWLVLVGPPSAGKSVLLQKCGLVDAKDLQQGVGGTRGMNWWFIDAESDGQPLHAVVLDMAGAVFMDQRQEGRWETFLRFLKKHRANEPLNGVMLVVSVQDLLGKTPEQLAQEGGQVRNQLEKIRAELGIRFPVWVIVTKCDLVDGFKEFTEAIERAGAGQMLGWSKPGKLDSPFDPRGVKEFIDSIVDRLRTFRTKTLADMITTPHAGGAGGAGGDRQSDRTDTLFGLPGTFAELGASLQKYLEIVFARKKISTAPPFMRGIYFTSSERKGASISKALKDLGIQPVEEQWPDRAFFNKDVFGQKVFRETLLVTNAENVDQLRRKRLVMAYLGATAAAILLIVLSIWSFLGVNKTIGSVTGFYAQLREAWPRLDTTDYKGDGAQALGITDRLGRPCPTLADVLQKSADYSSEKVSTPLIFFPIRFFAGDVGMNTERADIHRELVSRTLLRPIFEKSLTELSKRSAWSIDSFESAEKFKHAGDALAQLVHIGGLMSAGPSRGPTSSSGAIQLKPLLEFLKDQGDPAAADWLKSKQADQLDSLLAGTSGTPAGAITAANITDYRASLDTSKIMIALDAFHQEVVAQTNGTSGLLKQIGDLDASVKVALAAPEAFGKLMSGGGGVDTPEALAKLRQGWIDQSAILAAKVDDAQDRSAKLHTTPNWLTEISAALDELGRQYAAVDREVESAVAIAGSTSDTAKRWRDVMRPEGKSLDLAAIPTKKNEASLALQRCLTYVAKADAKSDLSALQHVKAMAAEVGTALAEKPEDKLATPSSADSLIWLPDEADAKAAPLAQAHQLMIDDLRTRSATWTLPPDGTNASFVLRMADQCTSALKVARRRAVGVQLEQYAARLARAGPLRAALAKTAKPDKIDNLPMSKLEREGGGNIAPEFTPEALGAFMTGWETAKATLCPDPGAPEPRPGEGPILDSATLVSTCATIRPAVQEYRDAALKYWNQELPDKLAPADTILSWKDFQLELAKLMGPGARRACDSLQKLEDMREKCLTALKADNLPPPASGPQWKWDALSKTRIDATAASCFDWLKLWGALPSEDPLAARGQASASPTASNYLQLCDVPYWQGIALKGMTTLAAGVGNSLGGRCAEFQQVAGLPLVKNSGRTMDVSTSAREQVRDTVCMLAGTSTGHSMVPAGAPACALTQAATALEHAGGSACSAITPEACDLAKLLAKGFTVSIQPGKLPAGVQGMDLVTAPYPNLAIREAKRGLANFKAASERILIACPTANPVVWEFAVSDTPGSRHILLTFSPWHVVNLIAMGDSSGATVTGDGTTWEVFIPDIGSCSAFTVKWGDNARIKACLALTITMEGADKLPTEAKWPSITK